MPSYLVVSDFKAGLDQRRSIITAPPGALWTASNVHITRGGEIEKRKAFAVSTSLPPGSFGLVVLRDAFYAFGSGVQPGSWPANVTYVRLQHPSGLAMTRLVSTALFAGKIYAIAEYSDGSQRHFYDAVRVPEWDTAGAYVGIKATDCITITKKIVVTAGSSLYFSKLNDPSTFTGTGAGVIDVAAEQEGMEALLALSRYQGQLAVFSRRTAVTYNVDVDLAQTSFAEAIQNAGLLAPRSAVPFGNTDTFILNDTGVRSVRARDSSNSPGIYDIGTPIDTIVTAAMSALDPAVVARARGVIEPVDGRYLLAVGTTIYVFSFFPGSKISAWSTYTIGAEIEAWATIGKRLYCRSGDSILEYGPDSAPYDASPVEIVLPMLDADKPAHNKQFLGVDGAVTGLWTVEAGMNPRLPSVRELVCHMDGTTFGLARFPAVGQGTHFGLRLTNAAPGAATIGKLALHYDMLDAD
jgi:hypothetical protein